MSNWIDDDTVEFELNDKQADFIEGVFYNLTAKGVKTAGIVGGIGSGKSFVMGFAILCSKEDLPMAKGQFACNTVKQFKRSIFPGVKSVWREHFNLVPYNFATGRAIIAYGRSRRPIGTAHGKSLTIGKTVFRFPTGG